MEIEVGKWYKRGNYRFIKILEIDERFASAITITYHEDFNQVDKGVSSWDLDIIREYFEPTDEYKILDILNEMI